MTLRFACCVALLLCHVVDGKGDSNLRLSNEILPAGSLSFLSLFFFIKLERNKERTGSNRVVRSTEKAIDALA